MFLRCSLMLIVLWFVAKPINAQQNYTDVAQSVGINHTYGDGLFGGGISFYDFNKDGWDDLTFATEGGNRIYFFENRGGTFVKLPPLVTNTSEQKQINWVDFDNDGDPDLFVASQMQGNKLYKNTGNLTFVDWTAAAGISQANLPSFGASWADVDHDGFLDLFILMRGYLSVNQNYFYKNNGDGTFTDATYSSGLEGANDSINFPFCATFFDYNNDGWSDVYVATDKFFGNTLYHNKGNGTFTDVSRASSAYLEMDAMSVAIGDFDNNNYLDIYTSNTNTNIGNALLKNNGDSTFQNVATTAGVTMQIYSWGSNFVDHDNDGDLDIYVSSAHPVPSQFSLSKLYDNNGNGTFTTMQYVGMAGDSLHSYSNAIGDFNNDGYPDIAVNNEYENSSLWLNSGGSNNWIKIALEGVSSNRDGTGTRIEVFSNGTKQIRQTTNGVGYLGQNSSYEIIGLGSATKIDSLIIYWPLGLVDKFYNVGVNKRIRLVEGVTNQRGGGAIYLNVPCTEDSFTIPPPPGTWIGYLWSTGDTTDSLTITQPGTYWITVTNQWNLDTVWGPLVVTISDAPILNLTASHLNCFGESTGTVLATVSGGVPPYTYTWNYPDSDNMLDSLTAGRYFLTLIDSVGCFIYDSIDVTEPPALVIDSFSADVLCYQDSNGMSWVDVTGGVSPYNYAWSTGSSTDSITNLHPGNYQLTVSDSNLCTSVSSVSIAEPSPLSAVYIPSDLLCNADNSGQIEVSASGGTVGYSINWLDGSTDFLHTNLAAGNYYFTVTDTNGCSFSDSSSLSEPSALSYSATTDSVGCSSALEGAATVIPMNGSPGYSISWNDGGPATFTRNNISAGDYVFTISDTNGCQLKDTVSVFAKIPLFITGDVTDVSCNGTLDGAIDLTINGGNGSTQILWSPVSGPQNLNNLAPGTYEAIAIDAGGCNDTASFTVAEPAILSSSNATTDITCIGLTDGTVLVSPIGGTPSYTIVWNDGSITGFNPSGLATGTQVFSILDTNNCTYTDSITVNAPAAINVVGVADSVSCFGGSDGQISLTLSGGTGTLSVDWGLAGIGNPLTSLSEATYFAVVTDSLGCSDTSSYQVLSPVALSATTSATDAFCFGDNTGTAFVTPQYGTAPYSISWGGSQTGFAPGMLTAGSYNFTITDANNCIYSNTALVGEASLIQATAVVDSASCLGVNDGSISLNLTGGTPGYTVNWSNADTGQTISNLAVGNYVATITDANGCSITQNYSVKVPANIMLFTLSTNATCYGLSNGAGSVSVLGGNAPYNYNWPVGITANNNPTGLAAGSYPFEVTDANGCAARDTLVIGQPAALTYTFNNTQVSCYGGANGSVGIQALGGTPSYSYAWSNNGMTTGLMAGNYTVTVTDAHGCQIAGSTTITQPDSLIVTTNISNLSCHGANDGLAWASVQGGTAAYSFNWSNAATADSIFNLSASQYQLTVTDSKGCTATGSTLVTEPVAISILMQTDSATGSLADGAAALSVMGGSTPYTYLWSNGSTNSFITDVVAGTYTVTVTDATGCTEGAIALIDSTLSTGINSINTAVGIQIYPNPASNWVTIEFDNTSTANIQLFNALGELVLKETASTRLHQINLTNFATGIYLYQIELNGQFVNGRLIKE